MTKLKKNQLYERIQTQKKNKEMRTKFKINNKWEKNLQFWIEGGNSNEKSNSQRIKKQKIAFKIMKIKVEISVN
jgi:hypothetical protein